MARGKRRGGGKKQRAFGGNSSLEKQSKRDVFSDEEDEAQEVRMNAKMDVDGVYEYEMPDKIDDDSEIDEDTAFNSEDEREYGMFFSSKNNKKKSRGDNAAQSEDEASDEDMDQMEEGGELLSDLLGTAPAQRLSTIDDAADADVVQATGDDDQDETFSSDEDDEDDDEEQERRKQANLVSLVDQLAPKKPKQKLVEIHEAAPLSEFGKSMLQQHHGAQDEAELTLESLLGGASVPKMDDDIQDDPTQQPQQQQEPVEQACTPSQETATLAHVKKQLSELRDPMTGLLTGALQGQVAKVHQDRAFRQLAYKQKQTEVSIFQPLVKANREKETLDFRVQIAKPDNLTPASLTSKFQPETALEKSIDSLLSTSEWQTARKVTKEEDQELLHQHQVSHDEVVQRRQELAKMRALMFYQEQKAKRIKKIKSKLYHKIRNAQNHKQMDKARAQLRELDPAMACQLDQEMAEKRAHERMTLKHTNTSKWVQHQLKRGINADQHTRAAIADQLKRGEELRRKVHTLDSDDDDDDVDDNDPESLTLVGKANALVMEIQQDEAQADQHKHKGLSGMKFMQRAVQKQREKALAEAEQLLQEIQRTENGGNSSDEESGGGAGADNSSNRRSNKKSKKQPLAQVSKETEEAVAKALPHGALRTQQAAMDKGFRAQASKPIAIDLEDPQTTSQEVEQVDPMETHPRVIELGKGEQHHQAPNGADNKNNKKRRQPQQPQDQNQTEADQTEENPWLAAESTHTTSKKRKKTKKSKSLAAPDVAQAVDSLMKTTSTTSTRSNNNYNKENTNATSTGTTTGTSKNAKKRQRQSSTNPKQDQANGTDLTLNQELVQRAFAFADEDEDEISKEKDLIASHDADAKTSAEVARLVGMTGWGSWAGEGAKTSWRQQKRQEQAQQVAREAKQKALASRADAKLDRVLLNEKKDRKAAKFTCASVPYPFTSREQYEMAMRNPLGSDWNTASSTNALTVPKIIKRAGTIIQPIALTKEDKDKALTQLAKRHKSQAKGGQRKAKF